MPQQIVPMMARLSSLPRDEDKYAYEIKWDGIRAIAFLDRGSLRLQSRNLLDITRQYPELQPLSRAFPERRLILDGEIVALDENGTPSFQRLQNRMGLADAIARKRSGAIPATYMIFDVLYLDDRSLFRTPYLQRQKLLRMLSLSGASWQTSGYHIGDAQALLDASRVMCLEGIVAKRTDSVYECGKRSGAWLKIKNTQRQECVIGGWLPGEGSRYGRIGSLLVGYYDKTPEQAAREKAPQKFVYAGKVGTGFSDAMLDDLLRLLKPYQQIDNPFEVNRPRFKQCVYVQPRFVCEIEYTGWTDATIMRHPSFKGLRNDKDPREVIKEVVSETE